VNGLSAILQNGAMHASDFIVDYMLPGHTATSSMSLTRYIDKDGDGYTPAQGDLNDLDPGVYPGAPRQYNTGKDANCNGVNEYTVDVYGNMNTVDRNTFCTRGGHAIHAVGYVTDAAGAVKVKNGQQVTTNSNGDINNLNLIWGFGPSNNDTKTMYCLDNSMPDGRICLEYNYNENHCQKYSSDDYNAYIYFGNSGNPGSCGGHHETDARYSYRYKTGSLRPLGFWHIYCD
jgi:hypothetical protein